MIAPGDSITIDFVTQDAQGTAQDADSLPVGTLVRNGSDTTEPVTITHKETGIYTALVAVPAEYAAGDRVQIRITATVAGVVKKRMILSETVQTIQDLLEADRIVDTSVTPWELVLIKKDTGGLDTGVELLRQQLRDVSGGAITDTSTVVGQLESGM